MIVFPRWGLLSPSTAQRHMDLIVTRLAEADVSASTFPKRCNAWSRHKCDVMMPTRWIDTVILCAGREEIRWAEQAHYLPHLQQPRYTVVPECGRAFLFVPCHGVHIKGVFLGDVFDPLIRLPGDGRHPGDLGAEKEPLAGKCLRRNN